jgi:monoamine oxidase
VVHGERAIRIETSRGAFEADAAILTAPLGVLQRGAVAFDPPLSEEKRAALGRLGMGVLDKVALRFPRAFWPRERHFVGYASARADEFPVFLNLARGGGAPILVGFAGGSAARELEGRSDAEIAGAAMAVLRRIFGRGVPEPEAAVATRWASDPDALGSYSNLRVGADPADYDRLAAPLAGGRLRFAGEATNRAHPATVHGAYLSGVREAERLLAIS